MNLKRVTRLGLAVAAASASLVFPSRTLRGQQPPPAPPEMVDPALRVNTAVSGLTTPIGIAFLRGLATQVLRELTGDPGAELHGDAQHFWPYGLNYTSEVTSNEDLIRHCVIVDAMQEDFER